MMSILRIPHRMARAEKSVAVVGGARTKRERYQRIWRPLSVLAVALTIVMSIVAAGGPAHAEAELHASAGPWVLTGWRSIPAAHADQGLATVATPGGGARLVTRGNADVTAQLRSTGWWHIGDPGSYRGYLVDALQGHAAMRAKLFVLTAPDGRRSDWTHRLVSGEMINNSFAAVSTSGRWLVSGEWGTIHRLLVFPMPRFNPAAVLGRNLPLSSTIRLTHAMRDVQGCAFASNTVLICSTNDTRHDLFPVPRQLLSIDLSHPLDGRPVAGAARLLGAIPQVSACGAAEAEGIDISGGTLRVVAHERHSCRGLVDMFTYRLSSDVGAKASVRAARPPVSR